MSEDVRAVAARIRELRELSGFTAAQVAEKSGVSAETYALYESGEVDLSISYLFGLSRIYGIDMSVILTGDQPHASRYFVVRKGKGVSVMRRADYKYQSLAYSFPHKKMEPFIVSVPHSDRPKDLYAHEGHEFAYVLQGTLVVVIDKQRITLQVGDSIYFDSTQPHALYAPDGEARFLVVIA